MTLEATFHSAKVSMGKYQGWRSFISSNSFNSLLFDLKRPVRAQGKTQNANVVVFTFEKRFIICMPPHGIIAISVQIDIARIGLFFQACNVYTLFPNLCQEVRLRKRFHHDSRVFICTFATFGNGENGQSWNWFSFLLPLFICRILPWQLRLQPVVEAMILDNGIQQPLLTIALWQRQGRTKTCRLLKLTCTHSQ